MNPVSSIQHPVSSNLQPVTCNPKPVCSRCGATDKEIIKRIRGTIYSPVPDSQWLRVVDAIKYQKLAFADALARFGYEQVQLQPCKTGYECRHCAPHNRAAELRKRKKQRPDNSANGFLF